jgi:hypothetical protein
MAIRDASVRRTGEIVCRARGTGMSIRRVMAETGRVLGIGTGSLLAALWSYIMWVPDGGFDLSALSSVGRFVLLLIGFLMCLLGIIATIASYRMHSAVLMVTFIASFVPLGAVLIRDDSGLRWLGILDLVLLAAAALIWWGRPRAGAAAGESNA